LVRLLTSRSMECGCKQPKMVVLIEWQHNRKNPRILSNSSSV
jgi:hypothetical protein